jgi:hypothetical protein
MSHTPSTIHIKKGDVVTVSSTGYSQHHLPLDPVISRVRNDVTWEQVLASYNISKVKAKKSIKHFITILFN